MDWDNNKEGNCDGSKGGGQALAMAIKRAKETGTRVVGNKEGNGNDDKSNGDGDEGGG